MSHDVRGVELRNKNDVQMVQKMMPRLPHTPNGSTVTSQSQHGHSTVTAQSQHSHSTATAQSKHSHSTVTETVQK